jgi:hypothetical protein
MLILIVLKLLSLGSPAGLFAHMLNFYFDGLMSWVFATASMLS